MKKFTEPEIKIFPLVIKDKITNDSLDGYRYDESNVLPEDGF